MKKITVTASRTYEVIMERGNLSKAGRYISEYLGAGKKICLITDATVDRLYGQENQDLWTCLEAEGFDVFKFVFPGGEKHKNMATITDILEFLAENKFTRSDILLALGGGITGDITGFAAASYLRGIEFIQVPTSLLAMVDSSVGGKTGVNLKSGKNLAGAFWQPSLVLFDPNVLKTLSYELKLDGVAEAIKAGFIANPEILSMINDKSKATSPAKTSLSASSNGLDDDDFLTELAALAVDVKRNIVEEDERENGRRQLLNLGHTLAHAIEKCSDFEISHGHAVAMGMAVISLAGLDYGLTDKETAAAMLNVLRQFNFPLDCPYSARELATVALQDKKRRGLNITLVIPETIGCCRLKQVPVTELEKIFAIGLEAMKKGNIQ